MEENKTTDEVMEEQVSCEDAAEESAQTENPSELLEKKIKELEAAIEEKDDRYLRMAAEYDNYRRRSAEEKSAVYDNALADTVKELLPILDNLERAALYEDGAGVKEGLRLTEKAVSSSLSALGVEIFGEVGEVFDPNLHNAVMHVEDESLGEGVITDVFQKGYKKGNKIIRFAMVKTAN